MAVCSQLPQDVWCVIGEKLHQTADRIRFRSVCTSWRSIIPFPQPPWLMLAEDAESPSTRGFFGLGHQQQEEEEQMVYQLELPEAHLRRCVGSAGKWLITVDGQERVCLLNPFSRCQIHLPSQPTFMLGFEYDGIYDFHPELRRNNLLRKAVISSPPSSLDCIVMVIYHYMSRLAIARPGDASWTIVPTPIHLLWADIIFYKQQFYGITQNGKLAVYDHLVHPPTTTLITTKRFKRWSGSVVRYLVEWMGELLFVIKVMDNDDDSKSYKLNRFIIYMFNFINKTWNEIKCLGDYSLFLGNNTPTAVLASDYPGLKNNCIYFTDDYLYGYSLYELPIGTVMGVYDLEDNSITPHYKGTSTCFHSPPLWVVPQFYQSSVAMASLIELD